MVGVPGKSKGCNTCRRRKKGCDQQRPVCGQCAASGYVCGGYQRDRTFILHPASKAVERATFLPHPRLVTGTVSNSFMRTAVDAQCRGLFWDMYMPSGDCVVRDKFILKCGHPMNWANVIPDLPQTDSSLENAFSALSISRVGKENGDVRLVRESTKFYGKALQDMQQALRDPDRMLKDEVLIATMLLGLYEVLERPNPRIDIWLTHAQGAARLMELRGPKAHKQWSAHHVFLGARMHIVYAAILQRRATFLATEEWLIYPWDEHRHRTYFDRMMDLCVMIPGLLETIDNLDTGTPGNILDAQRLDILYRFEAIQRSLYIWRGGRKEGAPHQVFPHVTSEGDSYPFDTELRFQNHLFAKAHLILWTCELVIAEAVADLQEKLHAEGDIEYVDRERLFDPRKSATRICEAILYCLQPNMGALGASLISFPANMAFRHFTRCGDVPVTRWLTKVFEETRSRGLQLNTQMFDKPTLLKKSTSEDTIILSLRDSSNESSPQADSPESTSSTGNQAVGSFIYEDPSKYYINTSVQKD